MHFNQLFKNPQEDLAIKIRTAQQINNDLYLEMLNDLKILDTERIVNEGVIDYQCDYFTIYYHKDSRCVGLYNVQHCSCYGTDENTPETFNDPKLKIVDTIEGFYIKCVNDTLNVDSDYETFNNYKYELTNSYKIWFENNFFQETDRVKLLHEKKEEQQRQQELQRLEEQQQQELQLKKQQEKEKEKEILEQEIGTPCILCSKKKLKEDLYQTKDGFECKTHDNDIDKYIKSIINTPL